MAFDFKLRYEPLQPKLLFVPKGKWTVCTYMTFSSIFTLTQQWESSFRSVFISRRHFLNGNFIRIDFHVNEIVLMWRNKKEEIKWCSKGKERKKKNDKDSSKKWLKFTIMCSCAFYIVFFSLVIILLNFYGFNFIKGWHFQFFWNLSL